MDRASAILSVNRALWGAVTASLRSVQVSFDESEMHLHFYFAGDPSDEDLEAMQVAATEVAADFPAAKVLEHGVATDPSTPLPHCAGHHTVFLRKEGKA
jgi:hypothetical protein